MSDLLLGPAVEFKFSAVVGGGDQQTTAGTVSGYAAVFGNTDDYGDVIALGAFRASLERHQSEGTRPLMLWSHDPSEIIGTWNSFVEDDKGLFGVGVLSLDVQRGREAHALLKAGAVDGLSIGFRVKKSEPLRAGAGGSGQRKLTEIELLEVSLVGLPANDKARVTGVKSIQTIRDFENKLRDELGFSHREAKRLASGGWPALADREDRGEGLDDLMRELQKAPNFLNHCDQQGEK